MRGTRIVLLLALVTALAASLLSVNVAAAAPLERVLVFSETAEFRHDSIPAGITAINELGAANGFQVDATEDSTAFNDANLAQYDAVVFLSTTGDVLTDEQQAAFERFIQAGNGYVGIHAGADTEYGWDWYGDLVGAYFASHPPGTPTAAVDVEDTTHPSTATLPTRWTRTDEWYNYKPPAAGPAVAEDYSPRYDVHVLARMDESTYDEQDGSAGADDHPIAWCSNFDGGHSWYTGFGHTAATFSEPDFREHLLGGLRSVTDFAGAGCGPMRVPSPSAADFEKVTLDDDTSNPFELDIAPDGRVFYIERDGRVMLWKPTTETTVQIGSVPVTQSQENGLLGMQLAPDFMTSGHIYLSYSALPDSSGQNRLSRFTVVGDQIQSGSEQIIYTWQHQREECCHTSGSLAFGLDGSLYISTGDNTNPFESNGFTPIDERPGREAWDAQRTSANSNDPNGKILRIVPLAGATGAPGIGTTYAIPPGNMFDEAQDTQNQTLPEIYAMGFRNPFRITIDPHTGWLLLGDYGPDAPSTVANRGPQGSVEFNVIDQPGFYGWPYCHRDNVAYNDYNFATGVSGAKFSCTNPVNNSPNNTGLTNLPPAQPATTWHGYSERDPRFPYLGTGGAPTGGPRYDFDAANPSTTKFPEYYDGKWFVGEWNEGWIKTVTLNDDGSGRGVGPFDLETGYLRPMDIEFGPDGSLYVIEWGSGFGGNNLDSGIYRIDYVGAGRRPIAQATATPDSGPAPLTVQFSSAGSNDPDGTSLTYAWDFDGDGSVDSTEPNPSFEYDTAGNYTATLRVTDETGATGVDNVPIVVGNSRPQVELVIPENGQVSAFGDVIPYEITVTDAEEGSTEDGGIDCADVTLNISLGHDEHAHELDEKTGCEGTFETLSASGHGEEANVFPVIEAVYTDSGSGAAGALTGRDEVILQPDPKQAEFFSSTGRVPGAPPGGDPGVQTETTSDPQGGGLNIGFIEDGDYVSYEPVNLEETRGIVFRVASGGAGGTIQLRLDAPDGPLVAETAPIAPTGGWQNWTDVELALPNPPEGTHELFVVFRGGAGGLMNLNFMRFQGRGAAISEAPEVTAAADPATGTAPLTVNFDGEATDADALPGDELTYQWDFGVPGTTTDTSTELDPTYTYERAGTYTATLTATDATGQRGRASVQVRVNPSDQCPIGPLRSDEFDGNSLDTDRWTVLRSNDNFEVSGGQLRLPIDNGSMYGPGTSARNIIVQDTPEGAWEVTAKITADELTQNFHQAGLRVYAGDDNWASVHMIHAGGQRDIEFIWEANGQPRNEAADKLGPAFPQDAPTTYYVRLVSDGEQLTAFYSFDGDTFLPVGRPGSLATFVDPQIGPAALSDAAPSTPDAFFDWIRFEPDGSGGGGGGTVDEFDGSALASPPWEVVRQDQNLTVSGGALRIPAAQGDIYGGGGNAKNLVLRPAPSGAWEAVAKLSFEGTAQYHQAGVLVYGDDDNFTKFGRIAHTEAGDEKFEFIYENAGTPRNDAPDSTPNLASDFPSDFFLRLRSDGTNLTGAYSTDGASWTPVGRPAPLPANARVGMFAFNNQAATAPEAAFDSFRLGPVGGGGPAGPSRDDQFDGSSLDTTRWNAIVRDNPSAYSVSGGELTITTEPGDIFTGDTNPPPNNFILQSADHAGDDWTIETKLSGTINGGYAQGGLMAYVDGSNYVKFDAISDAGNTRINRIELRSEVNGAIAAPEPNADVPVGTTDIWLRLAKTGTSYAGSYSFDGQTWTAMPAAVTNAIEAPRFGVYAFGPQPDGQGDTVSFDYFTLDGLDQGCECVARGDAFGGTGLDKTKWNEIVREDEAQYAVEDGGLTVTTVGGDIYEGSDPSGTRNFFLQSADHAGADYVLETKLSGTIDGGYAQGGLLVYTDDGNYVKFDAISDEGNTRINRIELRSEVGNAVQQPQPQADVPVGTTDIWLRLTKEGSTYSGEYSFDGTNWTALAQAVTNAQEAPRFGLFTLGVNNPGGTVTFDHFKVDGQLGCEEPPPENEPPVIESATASPTSGFAPLQVDFAVTATDADGDDLSYSWDFDGDGTEDSTAEDPSHTYAEAGVYDAEVTVSDGEAERTRTVTVTVLAPDDPSARFRVLVFSETTGFRHDSIDEGIAAIRALGRANEFQVDATEDSTVFRDSVLSHYDTVVFLSTTGDPLNNIQQAAFERYIRAGGGYTGIHAAADTEYDWNWYGHLVGGYFLSHPPGAPTATIDVEDRTNRSTGHLPARWERTDEWYNYRSPDFADPDVPDGDYSPREGGVHVLASLDESTYDEQDGNTTDDDHPIAWCQPYDGGRSWYTGGGHTAASYSEPDFLEHLLGGIEITAGAASSPECTNQGPSVQAAADPQTGNAPLTVSFTSAGSDPEGQNLVYSWDFGDGGRAFGQNATHTYQQAGTYMAKVTVTDPDGATGTAEIEIIVTEPPNRPPSVQAAADPGSGDAPLDVRFSAQGTDPDGDSLVYEWDFGDGGRAFGAQATHRYATAGEYDATVTVTDPDGATGTATVHVTVSGNHAPSVTMTADPQSGTAPLRVRFEAQGSDPDGGSLRYRWNFGDGSGPETDRRETHTYRNPGTYTARVTVTDREGASSSAELEITVTERRVNQAPTVTMTATPQTGAAPLEVLFSAVGSDPEGGPLSYRWSFGDDSDSRSGSEVTHRYRRSGTHTARVTVTDSEGARKSAELRITVTRSGGS